MSEDNKTNNVVLKGWVEFSGGLIARFPNEVKDEPLFDYNRKIAGFNFDNTLIKIKPQLIPNKYEFEFNFQNCIAKLADLSRHEYSIVVISDQTLIMNGTMSIEELQSKFDFFVKMLAERRIPIIGIFTTKVNCYVKPHTWTWRFLSEIYENAGIRIDLEESFYCGHLAGRVSAQYMHKDLNHSDRAYAHNICVEFKTPEEVFRSSSAKREYNFGDALTDADKDEFIHKELTKFKNSSLNKFRNIYEYFLNRSIELYPNSTQKPIFIMIMIGPPSSGKTKLANLIKTSAELLEKKQNISSVVIIGSAQNKQYKSHRYSKGITEKAYAEHIMAGQSIIFDDCHPSHTSRTNYFKTAINYNVPIIFVKINVSYQLSMQFNYIQMEKSQEFFQKPLSVTDFKKYNKEYQTPDLDKYMQKWNGLRCIAIEMPILIDSNIKEFRHIY